MLFAGLLFNLPMYLTNVWYSGYLPFNTNKLYDRHGKPFKVTQLVDERGNLDVEKYHKFGVNPFRALLKKFFSRFTQQEVTLSSLHCSLLATQRQSRTVYCFIVARFGPVSGVSSIAGIVANLRQIFTIV